jgi:broad specificity phosphatase PhoE
MSVKITYFVHGTTIDNEQHISSGWKDADLSDLGIEQSHKLRNLTPTASFEAVFCSDLKRAQITAQIAFGDRFRIIPDPRLRECNYGDLNGASSDIVEPRQEDNFHTKFPNGESYEDVKNRMLDFLNFLKTNYEGKHVAIVAHKAPQLALDVLLKGKTWEQALKEDWRKTKSWEPGWKYELN